MSRIVRILCALAISVVVSDIAAGSALAQSSRRKQPVKPIDLEEGAASENAPDPLTPKREDGPAPLAPGTPATPSATAPAEPAREVDPVIALVRGRLGALTPKAGADRDDVAGAVTFYASDAMAPVWVDKDGSTSRARQAIEEIRKADDWGLKATAYDLPAAVEPSASDEARADAEIKLSLAVLKYARHARGGRLNPPSISTRFDQKPVVYQPRSVLLAIAGTAAAGEYLRELHPQHEQFRRLQKALLAARAEPAGAKTASDITRIVVNMERWRWMPHDLGSFYVLDSVPEQMTRVIDNGKVTLAEKIVVGKPSSPTPVFSADMLFVIFHPSWGVPPGMKQHELWPQLKNSNGGWFSQKPAASTVLASHGLNVTRGGAPVDPNGIDWNAVDIRSFEFNQPPGPKNVLGAVKFRFPNRHDVYMHDTPERHLFGGAIRAFSHGCMRVQNPIRLAEVLLAHDKGWSVGEVQSMARRGGEVKLTKPIPVHITYFTVSVDDAGKLHVHPDIYGFDTRVATALEGRSVMVTSAAAAPVAAAGASPAQASGAGTEGSAKSNKSARPSRRVAKAGGRQKTDGAAPFNPFATLFGN